MHKVATLHGGNFKAARNVLCEWQNICCWQCLRRKRVANCAGVESKTKQKACWRLTIAMSLMLSPLLWPFSLWATLTLSLSLLKRNHTLLHSIRYLVLLLPRQEASSFRELLAWQRAFGQNSCWFACKTSKSHKLEQFLYTNGAFLIFSTTLKSYLHWKKTKGNKGK